MSNLRTFRVIPWCPAHARLFRATAIAACIGLGPVLLTGCHNAYESSPSTYEQSARSTGSKDNGPARRPRSFNRASKPMPVHGKLIWLDSESNTAIMKDNIRNGGSGRLTISVPHGDETYYIKLKELSPRRGEVLGAVIAPGRTLTVDVPLDGNGGTVYALHYGAGTAWYGERNAFGPAATYAKADDTFAFEEGTRWKVELILQPGGNLGTSGLDYQGF